MTHALDTRLPLVCVDTSYFIFHTYFSTRSRARIRDPDHVLVEFRRLVLKRVDELIRRYRTRAENVVFAVDCPRADIWRHELIERYKGTRAAKGSDSFDAKSFRVFFDAIEPELKARYRTCFLSCPGAEADDVAGVLARWKARQCPDWPMYVVSGDTDFVQLRTAHTEVVDATLEPLDASGTDPAEALFCKILCGDRSDNIPPVKARLGAKTAKALYASPDRMRALLEDPEVARRFEINTALVDLRRTPARIVDAVEGMVAAVGGPGSNNV